MCVCARVWGRCHASRAVRRGSGRTIRLPGVFYAAADTCYVCFETPRFYVRPDGCRSAMCLHCYMDLLRLRMKDVETVTRRGADDVAEAVSVSGCAGGARGCKGGGGAMCARPHTR